MAHPILVPQVGQDLTEAKIVELHVKLGDRVKKGDLVAVVESEKASFEVEAFAEGVVISLPFAEGDWAPVLEPLMLLGAPGETVGATPAVEAPVVTGPVAAVAAPAVGTPVSALSPVIAARPPVPEPATATAKGVILASPAARHLAAERGLDLARIAGSGPQGAVVLRDLGSATSAGLDLRTLQSGTGAPIVFIHGFGADLSSWRPLVGQIGLGLPMMALDLPGHGSAFAHAASDFDGIVAAVGLALRGLSGGVHLVGHSLGAAVATALTARGDLDVRSLTLIAPAGLGPTINNAFVEGFLNARTEPALAAWMRSLVADPATLAPVLVRATLAARDEPGLVPAQTRLAKGVFENGTQLFSVTAALRAFTGPCTVILGRDDAIIAPHEVIAALPAQVALHRLDRVGHLPQIEAAGLVTTLISRTVRAAG